jgi:hypothetical protein
MKSTLGSVVRQTLSLLLHSISNATQEANALHDPASIPHHSSRMQRYGLVRIVLSTRALVARCSCCPRPLAV